MKFPPSLRHVSFVALLLAVAVAAIAADSPGVARGGRVTWGRMITDDRYWNFHSDRDPGLARFIRQETTLNINPTWFSVDPVKLDELCAFPLVYVKNLSFVRGEDRLRNIAQYLKRGGFLCIDACITAPRTTDMEAYFRTNRDIMLRLVPGAEIRQLPPTHPIYHCYFKVTRDDIFPPGAGNGSFLKSDQHDGLYGVFAGERMVAVIGMYGLECAWPESPQRTPGCMKMIVNIYVHAMTR